MNTKTDSVQKIVDIFRAAPILKLNLSAVEEFVYPKMTLAEEAAPADDAAMDYSKERNRTRSAPEGPIERLRHGVERASEKPRFGHTSIEDWDDLLLFSNDRRSRKTPFKRRTSKQNTWSEGRFINESKNAFEDWLVNFCLPKFQEGGGGRHTQALTGSPGSGKSSLVKYVMSKYASELDYQGIVFSRFEFLKFLKDWHNFGADLHNSLRNYMSFIHLRDLFLSTFFRLDNGEKFIYRGEFATQLDRSKYVTAIAKEMSLKSKDFSSDNSQFHYVSVLDECIAKAEVSNQTFMNYIRRWTFEERVLLIYALWGDKTVVTIFDGLDSLNVEDAFQDTEEWSAIERIISNRANLSCPSILREQGISPRSDSFVVIRKNTLALLRSTLQERGESLKLSNVYTLGNIDGKSAIVSVVARSCQFIDDVKDLSEPDRAKFINDVVTIIQRTLLAISRGHGPRVSGKLTYGVFDGNLRELFKFVSRVVERSLNEMLQLGILSNKDIFGSTANLARLACAEGNSYLLQKSYQILEMFMYDGPCFENSLRTVQSRSKEFQGVQPKGTVFRNESFTGHVDNVFSYHFRGPAQNLDQHPLVEKIRVLQCLSDGGLTGDELRSKIRSKVGYVPPDFRILLLFLLKSDLISAEIIKLEDDYDFRYYSTPRARLIISSLLQNLSYIEHVFHKVRLPKELIGHIADQPKPSIGVERWAATAIHNAFVLICYLRHVEQNPSGGVQCPDEFAVFPSVHRGVTRSIIRMLDADKDPADVAPAAERIASQAHQMLSRTYKKWRTSSITPQSQRVSFLELDQSSSL